MSYIIVRGRWCHIIVLNVHALTQDKTDNVKESFYEEMECMFDKLPKYHLKIWSDFNAKVGREDISKQTIGNESLHKISNDNGIKVATSATPKTPTVKSMTFQHCSIHEYTWIYPDGKTHNQADHILTDR
jgi:hypothetical protein